MTSCERSNQTRVLSLAVIRLRLKSDDCFDNFKTSPLSSGAGLSLSMHGGVKPRAAAYSQLHILTPQRCQVEPESSAPGDGAGRFTGVAGG